MKMQASSPRCLKKKNLHMGVALGCPLIKCPVDSVTSTRSLRCGPQRRKGRERKRNGENKRRERKTKSKQI